MSHPARYLSRMLAWIDGTTGVWLMIATVALGWLGGRLLGPRK